MVPSERDDGADEQEEEEGGLISLLARLTQAYGVDPSDIEPTALLRVLPLHCLESRDQHLGV